MIQSNDALVIPPPGALFDQFTFIEGLSGWDQDDDLRGNSPLPADLVGHELTAEGIARIDGLSALLGGATSFTDGNIILGGAGNDTIEGRGGNDFIDGDAWLKAQLLAGGVLHDSMLELQDDVFARLLNPGDISIVRSIVPGAPAADADTALFSGPRDDYDITFGVAETDPTIVVHARNLIAVDDGTDTLVNVEFLQFTDQTIPVPTNPVNTTDGTAPTWVGGVATASNASTNALDLTWSGATDDIAVVDYNVYQNGTLTQTAVVGTSTTMTGLDPEMTYTFTVEARDAGPNESTDGPSVDGSTIAIASEIFFSTSGDATVPGVVGAPDDANIYTWTGSGYSMVQEAVATLGLDAAADVDGLTVVAPDHFFVSFTTAATAVPGLVDPVQDEDIVEFNAGTWSLFFDGTAAGVASVDGIHVNGSDVYFSTVGPTTVPGVGGVADDADVYLWNGSAFSRVWDATAALPGGGGLASTADIDGLTVAAPGHLYMSFQDTAVIPGLGTVQDEDIVEFNAGAWSLFFDGTSNGLTTADLGMDALSVPSDRLTLTGDNAVEVFVNGSLVGSSDNWTQASTLMTELTVDDVVAVHATDAGGMAGFLAEVSWDGGLAVSDASWKVSTTLETDWNMVGFDDIAWDPASSYGTYGVAPWFENVSGFPSSSTAEWIWSSDNVNVNEVWLRYVVGSPPPPSGSVTATADNAVEVFVNGSLVGSSDNWYQASTLMTELAVDDVVAVHATDAGGMAGFLAEVSWDGGLAVSDASWKVSTTLETDWNMVGFDDIAWDPASSYGTYGVAPWFENVSGFPSSSTAEWIWSADNVNVNEVWLRYVVGSPPPPSGSVTATADNAVEVFVNGSLVGSSDNWTQASTLMTELAVDDVVAVHATDAGGMAGFLAEVSWDGGLAVSDASWKVSTTLETDWNMVGFDDIAWDQASSYGTYGVAPWFENVSGFPSSSSAEWIWSSDNVNVNEVRLRYVVAP